MKAVGKCVRGMRRKNNEDSIFVSDGTGPIKDLYMVADGMGGHQAGEVASSLAIEAFQDYLEINCTDGEELLDSLVGAVHYSNSVLYQKAQEEEQLSGMGTTFIAAAFYNNKVYIVHVGDSRLYLFHENSLRQVTADHSMVMELVRQGRITKEEAEVHPAKNIITRALGTDKSVEADTIIEPVENGDIILLCTDGLTNMLSDQEIVDVLRENITIAEKVDRLIGDANAKGGFDNISLIIIEQEVEK